MSFDEDRRLHDLMSFVGIRAPVTAAAVLQLAKELRRVNLLDDDAIGRIQDAIVREVLLSRSPRTSTPEFEPGLRRQLSRLFSGDEATSSPSSQSGSVAS